VGQINDLLPVILVALTLWLLGLSAAYYWIFRHYQRLGKGVKAGNLIKVLDDIAQTEQTNTKQIEKLEKELLRQDKQAEIYVQNIGLVRFNPFDQTGGDHSFSLALLDREKNGFVLTSLHARDRTRVYVKEISSGKCKLELSKEEEKALSQAIK
jgi:hypothetical protein